VFLKVHQQVTGLLGHPLPRGCAVIPARCTRRVPCSMKNSTYRRRRNTVSTWKKSVARIVLAWASRNARQDCPDRLGAGPSPAPATARSGQFLAVLIPGQIRALLAEITNRAARFRRTSAALVPVRASLSVGWSA
jgi:hypothetical protein